MSKKKNKKINEKMAIVYTSLLSRITDFQLQSDDEYFVNKVEELRELLTILEQGTRE